MIDKIVKGLMIVISLFLIGYIVVVKMPKTSVKSKEAVASISAKDLYDEFSANEASATTKYLGKVLIVEGLIDDKYDDESGSPVVILKSGDDEPVALITLEATERGKLASYQINDMVKLKAQCSGILMEVTLNKGIIVE